MPGLPIAALMFVCPGLAAWILSGQGRGRFLSQALTVRWPDIRSWLAPAFLLPLAIAAGCWAVLRITGHPAPAIQPSPGHALGLFGLFLIAAFGEELGWSGYATNRLQRRWRALGAAVALGVIWALYHYVALWEAHRSPSWIAWWTLQTVALRIVLVWLYNNSRGSVVVASVCHGMVNTAWQLFPVHGSMMDPLASGLLWALTATTIVAIWGPGTLRGRRGAPCLR